MTSKLCLFAKKTKILLFMTVLISGVIVLHGYNWLSISSVTVKNLRAFMEENIQKASKQSSSKFNGSIIHRCDHDDGNVLCQESAHSTLIMLFKKYIQFSKRTQLPQIPCDNYMAKNILDKDLYNNSREVRRTPHYMYLRSPIGQMGNQMFQVAALLGISCYHGYTPIIAPSFELTNTFDLPYVTNITLTNFKTYVLYEPWGTFINDSLKLTPTQNWTLFGYFQSFKYFSRSMEAIRKSFVIKQQYLNTAYTFLKTVSKEGYANVCMHVRRGDMTTDYKIKRGRITADVNYINKSMEFYKRKYHFVNFIMLSDDVEWCKSNIAGVCFSPFTDPANDMAMMMLCDHVIMTSGTFGWWGAWLSRGTTVYFSNFIRKGSALDAGYKPADYFPPKWIGMT